MNARIIFVICLSCLFLFGACKEDEALKKKELELKQKELELKERELNQKDSLEKNTKDKQTIKTEKRQLRYVFYSNGGIVGYFNDGGIVGCPRCDLIKENIQALYKGKPHDSYTVHDGVIYSNKEGKLKPTNKEDGWAMINYEWLIEVK